MSQIPEDLKYTKEHEWVRILDGDNIRVGITAHAAEQLGDITMVELPREGDEVEKEDEFGSIESVKAVSAVYSPVTGTVTKANEVLEDNPEYINEDPYDEGWLIEVHMTDPGELAELMSASEYEKHIAEAED
ncbi:MAG: glycine cleavage system protein GcvH [Polyangia bacterium]|jgi:glycine cleavage system H protein|nr:glycine cleavage system protein GcvH [Polyangia bacterium]